jgi:hypothetical protein
MAEKKKPVKRVSIVRRKPAAVEPIKPAPPVPIYVAGLYVAPSTWSRLWRWITGK